MYKIMKKNIYRFLVFFIMVLSVFCAAFLIHSYYFFQNISHVFLKGPTAIISTDGVPIFQYLLSIDFTVPLGVLIMLTAPVVIGIIAYRMGKD